MKLRLLYIIIFAGLVSCKKDKERVTTYTVTTLAGEQGGFADGAATVARFNLPSGVAVDAQGTVYVADNFNHRIRKITSQGIVSTLAGTGSIGTADGSGSTAQFYDPTAVAVDAQGTVYVADYENHRIRKITSSGLVSTLAGSENAGFADGIGRAALFSHPRSISVDAQGAVYVADNSKIRRILPNGAVNTLAGSAGIGYTDGPGSTAQFGDFLSLVATAQGVVYVADYNNHCIRKITSVGIVSTIAGTGIPGFADGAGSTAQFNKPNGIAVDNQETLFVTDFVNFRVRKITPAGTVTTIAGTGNSGCIDGSGSTAQFGFIYGIAVNNQGVIYVADRGCNRIRQITAN